MIRKLFFSNTTWSLLSNAAAALLGFLNLALVARTYAKDDAGQWFMLLSVYTLLEMLRSGMVQTPFVRYFTVAEDKVEKAKLIAASWKVLLLFTAVLCIAALPFVYFFKAGDGAFKLVQTQLIIWLMAALPYQLLQWQLQANMLFKKLALIRILFPLAFTVLLGAAVRYRFSIEITALAYALLQLLTGIIGLTLGLLNFGNWFLNTRAESKKLMAFGRYSMLTMVAAGLLRSSDQFMIAAWLGPAAVAAYGIPQKLIEAIEIPVRSFAIIAMPHATNIWEQKKTEELRTFFYRQCGLLTMMILPLLVIFFCFPVSIVGLIGGAKYQGYSVLLQIFCFYAVLIPLDRYCGVLLDASNQPRKNTAKVLLMLGVNILFDWIALASGAGLFGVAAVSTITFLFGVIAGWLQLKDVLSHFKAKLFWNEGIMHHVKNLTNYIPAK